MKHYGTIFNPLHTHSKYAYNFHLRCLFIIDGEGVAVRGGGGFEASMKKINVFTKIILKICNLISDFCSKLHIIEFIVMLNSLGYSTSVFVLNVSEIHQFLFEASMKKINMFTKIILKIWNLIPDLSSKLHIIEFIVMLNSLGYSTSVFVLNISDIHQFLFVHVLMTVISVIMPCYIMSVSRSFVYYYWLLL